MVIFNIYIYINRTSNVDSISSNQKNDVNYEKWNPYEVIFWL
jgi:hypothetical protein